MLSAESHIRERLRHRLPSEVQVLAAADLGGVTDAAQFTPAVHVAFGGYRVIAADGEVTDIETTWHTVVAVRNARDQIDGKAARADACSIVGLLYQALAGWLPPGCSAVMRLSEAPQPAFSAGFYYLPLAWKTRLTLVAGRDAETAPTLTRVTADYGFEQEDIP